MDINQIVGANILRSREWLGMSQHDLVAALRIHGVSWHQTTVTRVERGERPVRIDELPGVLTVLGDVLAGTGLDEFRGDTARQEEVMTELLDRVIQSAQSLRDSYTQPKESK